MSIRLPRLLVYFALLLGVLLPAHARQQQTESLQEHDAVAQEIIVRFRGKNADAAGRDIRTQDADIRTITPVGRSGAVLLRSRGRSVAELMRAYARRPDVEYAEPNYILRATDVPNDPMFNQQWELQNTGQVLSGTPGADIKATAAWDITEGSRGIVVGLIDSGIEYADADLAPNIWSAPASFRVMIDGRWILCPAGSHGFNAITRNCDPADDDGHGTHTAGIIGAAGNDGVGISGVSRVANIMALKFLDPTGQGTTANAIAAIEFAIQVKQWFPTDANIRILNASWGGNPFSQVLLDQISAAGAHGMLFVTSAGNTGTDIDSSPDYPASYNAPNIITVTATDNRDSKAFFSNFGAASVDLAAPGVSILSTMLGAFHGRQNGTSASAAVVSGAAALVLSACKLDTSELKATLLNTVDVLLSLYGITVSGGLLNVSRAMNSCAGIPESFAFTASPTARTVAFTNSVDFTVSVAPLNGFSSSVSFEVFNLPPGMSASFSPSTVSDGASTMTVTISGVPDGNYPLKIVATGGGITRTTGVVVTVGLPVSCTLDANNLTASRSGMLDYLDAASLHRAPSFAEYCWLTLGADRALRITMDSSVDSYLYLLSTDGEILAYNDNDFNTNAGISVELPAGTYILEATSANPHETGSYSLSVRGAVPFIESITPDSGVQGTTVNITITGTRFFGTPLQVLVTNCQGAIVTNVNFLSSTAATATLMLPNVAANINCDIAVSAPGGTSNTKIFRMVPLPPTITSVSPNLGIQGQTIPITITGTNFVPPFSVYLRTPKNYLSPQSPKAWSLTTITLDLSIWINTEPGVYHFIVTTSGGDSNAVPFTIEFAPPVLNGLDPFVGGPGLSTGVVLRGTSFSEAFQINTPPEITVTNARYTDVTRIDATFTASPTAAFGDYPVTLSTPAGTSQASTFKLIPPPHITGFTPKRAFLGRTTAVTLTGTNLLCNMAAFIDGNVGAYFRSTNCNSRWAIVPSVAVDLVVPSSASVGPRTLTLTAPNGTSNPVMIDIVPVPPLIQTLTPVYGAQATNVAITLTGTDLESGIVNVSGAGVQASTQTTSPSTLTATLTIDGDAPIGARELTVTNSKGISDPVTFTVTPPKWPDLTIRQTIPAVQGSGYNETYVIAVRNEGTKETTSPIMVTNTTLFDVTFVSASPGWACSGSGRTITCTTPTSIPVNGEIALELTITVPMLTGFWSNEVEVSSPEDYYLGNNKATATAQLRFPGIPKLVVSPLLLEPGQQGTMSIELPEPFPHDIAGTMNSVSMSYASNPLGAPADPAAQFATGGRTVSYVIRANTLQAEFNGIPGPIGFQVGTLTGWLEFKATYELTSGSTLPISVTASIAQRPPTVSAVATETTSSGFVAVITMFSSTRQVHQLKFQFNTSKPIQLSCGGTTGCLASGSTLTFDVSSLFNTWYSNNTNYGSLATVRVPFNLQETISGNVGVTLTNSAGASAVATFPLP